MCVLAFVLYIYLSLVIIKASIIPSRSASSLEVQIQQSAFGSINTVTNANDRSRTRVLNNDETPCTMSGKLGVPFFPNVRLDWLNTSCAEAGSYFSQVAISLNDTVERSENTKSQIWVVPNGPVRLVFAPCGPNLV
jgi:hypothetical protein